MARTESHGRRRWRRTLAVAAIVAGFGLLGTAAAMLWQVGHAPAYRYVIGDAVAPDELGPLKPLAERGIDVLQARVETAGGVPLARFEIARSPAGPVAVDWQSRVDPPFLRILPQPRDVTSLAPVLQRHMPSDTVLMAWWDSSRFLAMLSGVDVAFGQHLGIPLFLPQRWRGRRGRIESIEAEFWQSRTEPEARARFRRFVDALLSDERQGVNKLRALAGDRPAVLALHVRDVILLGQLAPERIGVAFRDIQATGDVHAMVQRAYGWLEANDYSAYTIMRLDDHQVRLIALTDDASGNTLAARLLPFIGNSQEPVAGTSLVYQTGGFWVYELAPKAVTTASRGG